jgi:hypothetical protein
MTITGRRRLAAAAAVIAGVSLLAAPSPASATIQYCHSESFISNACLYFVQIGLSDHVDAHVGIDVYMPEQYGREILQCGGNGQFAAALWGDDGGGSGDDFIRNLVLNPGWPAGGMDGIGAEFTALDVRPSELDEDDGEDEVYARISFLDCHTGETRHFTTGVWHSVIHLPPR